MRTFIVLKRIQRRLLPPEFQSQDNRYPEALVEYFLGKYTEPGDTVLDLFAGLGTTMFVAEEMGRVPYGIELDRSRFEFIKSQVQHKSNVIQGDALRLDSYGLPRIDFAMSSPPYMNRDDGMNPLTCSRTDGDYASYLRDLGRVYTKVKKVLKPHARVVIEASNLKRGEVTLFAWDVAREISRLFYFEGEVVVGWEGQDNGCGTYGYGYDHSYCLVFKNLP